MPARIAILYSNVVTFLGFRSTRKREGSHEQALNRGSQQTYPGGIADGPMEKSEEAIEELHGVFERHLSKLPADEQIRRWNALQEYVKKFGPSDTHAKRYGPHSIPVNPR
jgi:hypothetical protein